MALYVCRECGTSWTGGGEGVCDSCGSPVSGQSSCPSCGSEVWSPVDLGEEFFYLMREGLTPARALYYYMHSVHGVSIEDIADLCGRTETSVYNVISKAEEALERA